MKQTLVTIQFISVIAGGVLCICSTGGQVCGQTAVSDVTATINFGNNRSVTANSNGRLLEPVGLQPNQVVDITVQLLATKAGRTIVAEPLDGGGIVAPSNKFIVAIDGTISLRFEAGGAPGIYHVALHDRDQEVALQFWIADPQHPQCNPRVLTPNNASI